VPGPSHFADQERRKSDKILFYFIFSISSYNIKLPDHTNHATDLKSSLKRFLGKEEK
jgi:hypothetical protein